MARRTTNSYYTEGNVAKKIEFQSGSAAPARRREETVPAPARRRKQKPLSPRQLRELEKESSRAKYRRVDSESMSRGYVVFLSAMVGISLFLSVQYLNCRADITSAKSNINTLQSSVEVLSSQNDAVAYDIEGYIDINHVIDVATNELGMVRASEDQVKYFEKNVDEFMNQYADVPEE